MASANITKATKRSHMKAEVVVCVGSNTGAKEENIALAIDWLQGILAGCRVSGIYMSPDTTGSLETYGNAVAIGLSDLSRSELELTAKEYELKCGRDNAARNAGIVPIDVDIVVYDGEIVRPRDYASNFFKIGFDQIARR